VPQAYGAEPSIEERLLNDFDYVPAAGQPAYYDDSVGRRCPVGAHIRRLNPRGAAVMGRPYTRRIVRRGMPYGPPYDPRHGNGGAERGLVGLFMCGDLELQYEFLMRVWANQDFAAAGVKGTRDPLIGAQQDSGGSFAVPTNDGDGPIVMTGLPRLVQTRGSLYCFIPGVGGLRYLSALPDGAGA
jgi:deferrochelatase/peroxidase EfeB